MLGLCFKERRKETEYSYERETGHVLSEATEVLTDGD